MSRRNVELLLLFIAAPIVIVLFAMMVVSGAGSEEGLQSLSFNTLVVPIGMFLVFLLAHVAVRKLAPGADPALLPITFALCGFGISFVTRLAPTDATRQLVWMFLGVAVMVCALLAIKNIEKLSEYKYTLITLGVLLLLSPMLPVVGNEVNGSRLWLNFGGMFSFQPGEIAKICIVLFLAAYLAQNRETLSIFTAKLGPFKLPSLRTLLPLLVMWALAFAIVVLEKDLGSALVLFCMFLVMLYVATGKKVYVIIGVLLAGIAAYLLYSMFSHVQTRVEIWLDPFADAQNKGYQILQALYSIADGGLFGSGIGRGMADVIPYAESDFIFAAIAEEAGLLGAAAVLLLYLMFAIRGMLAAANARSDFGSFTAVGATSIVILQAFIIVAGVIRLIPLTGITLPFVSQGGSSLLAGFIIVALLLRISDQATGHSVEMASTRRDPAKASRHAVVDEHGVLGRGALGRRLTKTMVGYSLLFALLVADLTFIMVIDANRIQNLSSNNHSIQREATRERGIISTHDGVVLARSVELPDGIYVREYPEGTLAAHVIGYYSMEYGSAGIEAAMNDTLRGTENFASWNDVIASYAGIQSNGNDVALTIDSDTQKAAEEAIANYKGAAVVLDPETGAVLAMASSPTYDPSNLGDVLKKATDGATTDASELLNRATQALYPPGSTFKIVTLAGALQDGVANETTKYDAAGKIDIGNAPVTNFKEKDYGDITLARAFEVSSNTVFGQVGEQLGARRLVDIAQTFGFNKQFSFELPLAKSLMPDPDEMTVWETAWAADGVPVGEHESPAGPQATVLEMALVGSAIVNEGTIMEPYLVEGTYNTNGSRSYTAEPKKLWQTVNSDVSKRVFDVMKGVIADGTAQDAAIPGVTVAGKTGTAEHKGRDDDSWFVGIARTVDGERQVVIALMLEEVGSDVHASGVSRSVLQAALN